MWLYLVLLMTVVPTVELALLLAIHGRIGLAPTVLLVLATGVIGASLARRQGLQTLWRVRDQLARGEAPGDALLDGALILVAGAVLITPGVLTDAFGFALLVPPLRSVVKRLLRRAFRGSVTVTGAWRGGAGPAADQAPPSDEIIDVRVSEVRPKELKQTDTP